MAETGRRRVLQGLAGILGTFYLSKYWPELPISGELAVSVFDRDCARECCAVYEAWLKQEKMLPKEYLANKGVCDIRKGEGLYSELLPAEFAANDIIEVNGFVMAKSEAAMVAYLGQLLS